MFSRDFYNQLWISTKIWLIACFLTTVFGVLVCAIVNMIFFGPEFIAGLVMAILIFSFPVFASILIFITGSVRFNKSGNWIRNGTHIIAAILTLVMCMVFGVLEGIHGEIELFIVAIVLTQLCAILGIISDQYSLKRLGSEYRVNSFMNALEQTR